MLFTVALALGPTPPAASSDVETGGALPPASTLAPPTAVLDQLRRAGLSPSDVGLVARPVEGDGPALFELNPEQPRIMASTAKVVTAMAALDLLGPKYRWSTRAYLQGTLADGLLGGNLVIVGGGDPLLTSKALTAWFRQMQKKGLSEVHGDIVLDRQAFRLTPRDFVQSPPENPDKPHHRWPEALVVDKGLLQASVQAGAPAGQARVSFQPALESIELVDLLRVKAGRCHHSADLDLESPPEGLRVILKGESSAACGSRELEMSTPAGSAFSRAALAGAWIGAGGFLSGRVTDGAMTWPRPAGKKRAAPRLKPFAELTSDPLPEVLQLMDKRSDNLVARHVFLSLSPGFPARPATMPDARARVATWLKQRGLAPDDVSMDNGSGLSLAEQARPRALVQLLQSQWRSKHRQAFFHSLPVAGQDGTLAGRLRGTEAQGRAHLKTGTLQTSSALAGYVQGRSGKYYAVAALVNHPHAGRGVPALDAFIEWVVRNG